jgi:hypothetical protein
LPCAHLRVSNPMLEEAADGKRRTTAASVRVRRFGTG